MLAYPHEVVQNHPPYKRARDRAQQLLGPRGGFHPRSGLVQPSLELRDDPMLAQLTSQDDRIQIGVGTYASGEPLIRLHHPNNKVLIGKFCSFAHAVTIFAGGNHPMKYVSTHPLKLYFGVDDFTSWTADCGDGDETTKIGNDVWLGHGSVIMSGAEIGDGAIIGAQAVVRGKIPPYAIVLGNPAIIIRYRYDQQTINQLQAIRWWDWPIEKIKDEISNLTSSDIADFLSRHGSTTTDVN